MTSVSRGTGQEATEDGALARDLFDRIISQKLVRPQELRVHADNGSPMRSVVLNQFFNRLEVRCTHSRPHTSDDNAFIESLFSVLKGRASFPEYFKDIIQARTYVQALVKWYNTKHMHSRLDYLTPMEVEQGKAHEIQARRNKVIEKARALRPQRFGKRKLYFRVPKSVKLAFHETVSYD